MVNYNPKNKSELFLGRMKTFDAQLRSSQRGREPGHHDTIVYCAPFESDVVFIEGRRGGRRRCESVDDNKLPSLVNQESDGVK